MKGLILAGGAGTRLYPISTVIVKQLLPIYDKPMIYYPLSMLMLGGIRDIMLISTPKDIPLFEKLFGDGSHLGISITYKVQPSPDGLPQAFILGEEFIKNDDVALILGDNVFYGDYTLFAKAIESHQKKEHGSRAKIFGYQVSNPEIYGVVEYDSQSKRVLSMEEKPTHPKSNYAIPGFYLFDETAAERAKKLKPSNRGELEMVDMIKSYINEDTLSVQLIDRGIAWLDTGSVNEMRAASSFISAIEQRQGIKVACIEEIALRMNYIDLEQFSKIIETTPKGHYQDYLKIVYSEFKKHENK